MGGALVRAEHTREVYMLLHCTRDDPHLPFFHSGLGSLFVSVAHQAYAQAGYPCTGLACCSFPHSQVPTGGKRMKKISESFMFHDALRPGLAGVSERERSRGKAVLGDHPAPAPQVQV